MAAAAAAATLPDELPDEPPAEDPPELLDPAIQLPESCAANGDFFRRSYGEFEFCLTSDSATVTEVMMAFEDTDDGSEDEDEAEVPAAAAEEDAPDPSEPDVAVDEEDAVLVLVLFDRIRLLEEEEADDELLLLLLLEDAELAVDDPEPDNRAGPLFCWPAGEAPTFGAGMF